MKSAEFEKVRKELQAMLAIQAGQTAVLIAMVQTHPRHEDFQMAMTNALETALAGIPATVMTAQMQEMARAYAELLQLMPPADPGEPGAKARSVLSAL